MRLKLISCEIFAREVQAVQARSRNDIDVELLAKCLGELLQPVEAASHQH